MNKYYFKTPYRPNKNGLPVKEEVTTSSRLLCSSTLFLCNVCKQNCLPEHRTSDARLRTNKNKKAYLWFRSNSHWTSYPFTQVHLSPPKPTPRVARTLQVTRAYCPPPFVTDTLPSLLIKGQCCHNRGPPPATNTAIAP